MSSYRFPLHCCFWILLLVLLGVPAAEVVPGPGEQGRVANEDARFGGIYRAPLLNNPKTLDPAYVEDMYSTTVVQQLFDGLVQYSPDLLVVPALAESWRVEEKGKAYRFFLRKDATFHNGRKITARDVIFSLSRPLRTTPSPSIMPHLLKIVGAREYSESRVDHVAGLQAIDEHTVLVRLEDTYVPFLIALGMYQAKIVPEEEVLAKGAEFGKRPVGSGPFKFVSWQENRLLRLERFPDYYGGKAFLDEVNYLIFPGIQIEEVYGAFTKKELHEMPAFPQVKKRLSEQKEAVLIQRPSLSLQFYGFNCRHPLLKELDVRRALSLAVDRKELVARVYENLIEPATNILPPGLPGSQPQAQESTFDAARALELMKHALSDRSGTAINLEVVSNSQSAFAQAELSFIRDSWAHLGINLTPRFIPDWSEFEQVVKSDSMQIYRYAWYASMPDPDSFLQPLFGTDADANFMRYRDDEVNRMLNEARTIVDPVERAKMYQTIQEAVSRASPLLPLFYMSIPYAYHSSVQGIQVSALGAQKMSYHRVWLKKTGSP